ncbi:MAG TPA: LLM class flavin-dependent oxidoreductase [Acidimicrobiales bacterium]|nr:LLM class flavin-dependent oxidoreductase [Acidimicrobiales bacterium]
MLDLVPVPSGATPGEAIARSVELARLAERLGYRRYWVAEHHNMPGVASSTPAVMVAHLAAATSTIRVGAGGVMLPNHAALAVAETWGLLATMHPGRIDLGIGRAPGTDPATARALRRVPEHTAGGGDPFAEQLGELLAFLHGSWPDDHPYRRIRAVPAADVPPSIWLLGSSTYGAQMAGMLGLPFSFAHHFSPAYTLPAAELYRSTFRPSAALDEPHLAIGVAVLAADTDEEARHLHGSTRLSMLRLRTGRPGLLPSPEEAAAYPFTADELRAVEAFCGSHVVGSPATVRAGLDELVERTGADELVVTTSAWSHEARLRSYELVAEALAPTPA